MYDIKANEFLKQQVAAAAAVTTTTTTNTRNTVVNNSLLAAPITTTASAQIGSTAAYTPHLLNAYSTCSIISHAKLEQQHQPQQQQQQQHSNALHRSHPSLNRSAALRNPADSTHMTLLSLRRRRLLQRHACLLSILAAFIFGLALGVFMPMFGLPQFLNPLSSAAAVAPEGTDGSAGSLPMLPFSEAQAAPLVRNNDTLTASAAVAAAAHPPSHFPTIYEPPMAVESSTSAEAAPVTGQNPFSVAFIKEQEVELSAQQIFRNVFHLQPDANAPNSLLLQKVDERDGSVREFRVQRVAEGRYRKGPEQKAKTKAGSSAAADVITFVPLAQRIAAHASSSAQQQNDNSIIKEDIYWGQLVERALPQGFSAQDTRDWNRYLTTQGVVERLEAGCGRMQNRLVVFADGTRACARYRQNTDQIQGELFSFYLGQLLNLSNLAPSAASVVDLDTRTWSSAVVDITQAQWKQQRPVVLTRWLPDLEPAGIPQPFRPLERHLNKFDVWNITLAAAAEALRDAKPDGENENGSQAQTQGLLKRLGAATSAQTAHQSHRTTDSPLSALNASTISSTEGAPSPVLQRLVELAQWSDLIVFDYLIANLDRVVNNLYNFQWNADIMAAPAHNLARQTHTQLLVFLDNESGLLHGYRLLKKYEAYHGLLLDNLCVFRQPTIDALRQLRAYGAGRRLRELFEQTANAEVRDVLPTLPDKSIKILVDRIDRVLGQVQKCRELLADR